VSAYIDIMRAMSGPPVMEPMQFIVNMRRSWSGFRR